MTIDTIYAVAFGIYFLGMAAVAISLTVTNKEKKDKQRKQQKEAFPLLTQGFNNEVPIDEDDIRLICKKYKFPSYVKFLEEYLLFLRDGNSSELKDFNAVNSLIKSILSRERSSSPYEGISDSDRRLLLSIEETAHDDSIKRIIKSNLYDLSDSIREKDQNLRKVKRLNSWMIPLTVISFIITIATYIWGSRLSQKDLGKLEEHFSTILEQHFSSEDNSQLDITNSLND